MVHLSVPKTFRSLSSARISRLLFGFCRLFLRIWSHTFETTSLRGSGLEPTIAARSDDGVTGRASPPPALRPVPFAIWPSCCSAPMVERDSPRCARGRAARKWLIHLLVERNDAIGRVMANFGMAAEGNSGPLAPVSNNRLGVAPKYRIVFGDVA